MAFQAETLQAAPEFSYRLLDAIPEVASARLIVRKQAEALLESRRKIQDQSPEAPEFISIDALSTADRVIETEGLHGRDSVEYTEVLEGLRLDSQRLVGEWYRKKKAEYFAPTRHIFDAKSGDFFSHGFSTGKMTENALVPIPDDAEEEARRINERVEEATPHIARTLGAIALGGREALRTISQCSDKAIQDYQTDQRLGRAHRGYNGQVPEIEKMMIRDIWLDDQTQDRFEVQLALPGVYFPQYVLQKALAQRGVSVEQMNKTELHGAQMLVRDDLIEFAELLDTVASEEWCTNIYMGEVVPHNFVKNYAGFKQEALQRQESLKDLAVTVTTFVLDLARDGFDRQLAPAHVEAFVKKLLLDLGKKDFRVAEQMFDEDTAKGLQEVALLERLGRSDEAYRRMQQVEKAAPGGGFCGAGSCGLEGVNKNSEEGASLLQKLRAKTGDTLVRDKERPCKCGRKNVVYAYNKNKVNKYCESCGAFESKNSSAAAQTAAAKQSDFSLAA